MECTFPYRSRPLFPSRTIGELAEDYDSFFFESWKTAKKQNVVGSVNTSVKNRDLTLEQPRYRGLFRLL